MIRIALYGRSVDIEFLFTHDACVDVRSSVESCGARVRNGLTDAPQGIFTQTAVLSY